MTPQDIEAAIGTLPDKLSDLLEVALDDFEKVTKHPSVVVDMGSWCDATNGRECLVCLAGAVMAQRATPEAVLERKRLLTPGMISSDDTWSKLRALDYLRSGEIALAWETLHGANLGEVPDELELVPIAHSDGSEGFIPEMRSLIALLRTHHL